MTKANLVAAVVCLLTYCSSSSALVAAGVGFNSVTSGRQIPAVSLALGTESWFVSGHSVGTRSGYSYVSGYAVSFFKGVKPGKVLHGDVKAGFGLGLYFTERGYKPTETAATEKISDFGGGPAFRVNWYFLGPGYMGIEALFGLRDLMQNLTMAYQDYVLFSVGVGF